jgi:hypothetical protein
VLRAAIVPQIPAWWPLVAIIAVAALIVLAGICDELHLVWITHEERLQAICLGVSIKPFDWRLGDVTRPGYPGRWGALGPLRIGGKVRA